MRGWAVALLLAWTWIPTLADPAGAQGIEQAVARFGRALTAADTSHLKSLLPSRGKVRLRLICLGPEQGAYSGSQVVALLNDFLRQGSVEAFTLHRAETADAGLALAHGIAALTDREGKARRINLHLTLQQESGRWVLREVRESPR